MAHANPQKSDRAIAEELGVGHATVSRARATVSSETVEKRVGKDGKARAMPERKRGHRPTEERAREIVRPLVEAGKAPTSKDARTLEKDHGISHVMFEQATAAERARVQAFDEIEVDPETLKPSAKAKLEAAKRMMERKLKVEHALRMKQIDDEVGRRVAKEGKAYHDRLMASMAKHFELEDRYRALINDHKAIFTLGEFMAILKCLHPDNSASPETRAEGFRLFNSKKLQLTKET
jgi:hypothetical protein